MKTVKSNGTEIHLDCGGIVIKGTCTRCGERKSGLIRKFLGDRTAPYIEKKPKFDEEAYRSRIRNMDDLKKGKK